LLIVLQALTIREEEAKQRDPNPADASRSATPERPDMELEALRVVNLELEARIDALEESEELLTAKLEVALEAGTMAHNAIAQAQRQAGGEATPTEGTRPQGREVLSPLETPEVPAEAASRWRGGGAGGAVMCRMSPVGRVAVLASMEPGERKAVMGGLDAATQASTLGAMLYVERQAALSEMTPGEAARVLSEMADGQRVNGLMSLASDGDPSPRRGTFNAMSLVVRVATLAAMMEEERQVILTALSREERDCLEAYVQVNNTPSQPIPCLAL